MSAGCLEKANSACRTGMCSRSFCLENVRLGTGRLLLRAKPCDMLAFPNGVRLRCSIATSICDWQTLNHVDEIAVSNGAVFHFRKRPQRKFLVCFQQLRVGCTRDNGYTSVYEVLSQCIVHRLQQLCNFGGLQSRFERVTCTTHKLMSP